MAYLVLLSLWSQLVKVGIFLLEIVVFLTLNQLPTAPLVLIGTADNVFNQDQTMETFVTVEHTGLEILATIEVQTNQVDQDLAAITIIGAQLPTVALDDQFNRYIVN